MNEVLALKCAVRNSARSLAQGGISCRDGVEVFGAGHLKRYMSDINPVVSPAHLGFSPSKRSVGHFPKVRLYEISRDAKRPIVILVANGIVRPLLVQLLE